MSIINTTRHTMARIYNDTGARPNELIGDTGFVLRLRRELATPYQMSQPIQEGNFLLGMRIFESPLVPAGHFMLGGQLVRYIKPTLDEMCAEARKRLAEALERDVNAAHVAIARSFAALGVA